MTAEQRKKFHAELDSRGEENVRAHLAAGVWNPEKVKIAEDWLQARHLSQEHEVNRDNLRTAKSAKNAAWVAAIAAIIANIIAASAIVISVLALRQGAA